MTKENIKLKLNSENEWTIFIGNRWIDSGKNTKFVAFLPILEVLLDNSIELLNELSALANEEQINFLIKKNLRTALVSESVYWIEMAIRYIIEQNYPNKDFISYLSLYKYDKRLPQKLRQKMGNVSDR